MLDDFHARIEAKYGLGSGSNAVEWEHLSSFLGINIIYDVKNRHLTMDVAAKIDALFEEHKILRMLPNKATPLPDSTSAKSRPLLSPAIAAHIHEHYASLVGALIYMSVSCRPDIAYGVGRLSRHMHGPTEEAVMDCAHLLGYLGDAKHKGLGLLFCVDNNLMRKHMCRMHGEHRNGMIRGIQGAITDVHGRPIDTFTDSNLCGSRAEQCKSTSGFCVFHLFHLISWKSKLQPITASSSHEAELIALAYGADELMWIRKLLDELYFCYAHMILPLDDDKTEPAQVRESVLSAFDAAPALLATSERSHIKQVLTSPDSDDELKRLNELFKLENARPSWHDNFKFLTRFQATPLLTDNLSLKHTVSNPDTNQARSRHLDMRLFKIRDFIKGRCARVVHIDTTDNVADMFTKPLGTTAFRLFRDLFMTVAIMPMIKPKKSTGLLSMFN